MAKSLEAELVLKRCYFSTLFTVAAKLKTSARIKVINNFSSNRFCASGDLDHGGEAGSCFVSVIFLTF